MTKKKKIILNEFIVSTLNNFKGRNLATDEHDPTDRRIHMTPNDIATILVNDFDVAGYTIGTIKQR